MKTYKCYTILFDSEECTINHTEAVVERIKKDNKTISKIEFHGIVLREID